MLLHGIAEGGRRADSFDTILPYLYSDVGLKVVSRVKWDESQKPPDWDKKTFEKFNKGEPDVVLYSYDPNYYGEYKPGDGVLAKTWEAAEKIQKGGVNYGVSNRRLSPLDILKSDRGSIEIEPKKRKRKFLRTIQEAREIDPELKAGVAEIDPQEYSVARMEESLAFGREKIQTEGIAAALDYARDANNPQAERSGVYQEAIKEYQRIRDWDNATALVDEVARVATGYGQFTQLLSVWTKTVSPEGFIRWANKQLKNAEAKYGMADSIVGRKPDDFKLTKEEQIAIFEKYREIDQMTEELDRQDATLELIEMVAQKVPPSVTEMFDAFRFQNMLSGPTTQLRNTGWNVEATFMARPFDIATRAAIDWVQSGLTGKEREAYIRDVPVYLKAVINAVPNGARAYWDTMRMVKGTSFEKPEIGIEASTELQRARAKQLPGALTVVPRHMEGTDKFLQTMICAGEMARLMKNGVPEPEAYFQGVELAKEYLLRNDFELNDPRLSMFSQALNSIGVGMEHFRKLPVVGKASSWYVPFIRTPIRVGIQMIEHSPVGAIRGQWTQEAAAKVVSGSIVTAAGALMAASGDTTWAPPTNEQEKRLFYATKRVPYSYRFPGTDKWIPVWYFGPYALAMAIPAAAKYYFDQNQKALTQEHYEKLFEMSYGLAKFVGSQSSTQSIGAFFAFTAGDIDYSFYSQTAFTVQQVIPGSSFIRYVNTWIDPIFRHPKGFTERIEANLPVLSKNIEAHTDPLGEPSRREKINYFLPYTVGMADDTYEKDYRLLRERLGDEAVMKKDFDKMKSDFEKQIKFSKPKKKTKVTH
jgi:hypothetical protein